MTVIDLRATVDLRERRIIVLAHDIQQMFFADPEDPDPVEPLIVEIVAETRGASPEELDLRYRCAIAYFAAAPDGTIDFKADPARNHAGCLAWSCAYLERLQDDYGVRLLDGPRARA